MEIMALNDAEIEALVRAKYKGKKVPQSVIDQEVSDLKALREENRERMNKLNLNLVDKKL